MFLENILEVIKEELKIDLTTSKTRDRDIVDARRIYCDLAKQLDIYSYVEIGKPINRKHCSVIHLCNTSDVLKTTDKDYNFKYNLIFDKTIKINTDDNIRQNYHYYKKKFEKYRDLLNELRDYNRTKEDYLKKAS